MQLTIENIDRPTTTDIRPIGTVNIISNTVVIENATNVTDVIVLRLIHCTAEVSSNRTTGIPSSIAGELDHMSTRIAGERSANNTASTIDKVVPSRKDCTTVVLGSVVLELDVIPQIAHLDVVCIRTTDVG
ncbi:hypothetical protein HRbin20_01544 [bacterium HR20]|nr:hypothetical protein HRbin20_01544 [bacterium HR20]